MHAFGRAILSPERNREKVLDGIEYGELVNFRSLFEQCTGRKVPICQLLDGDVILLVLSLARFFIFLFIPTKLQKQQVIWTRSYLVWSSEILIPNCCDRVLQETSKMPNEGDDAPMIVSSHSENNESRSERNGRDKHRMPTEGDDVPVAVTSKSENNESQSERNDRHRYRIRNASLFNFVYPNHITDKYELLEVLGHGTFGVVRKCKNIVTGEEFALKTILKEKIPDVELLKTEITILLEVDHPHIIKLYDVYEDVINVFLVTELCTGGELYDRVIEKTRSPEGHFSEFCAARIIRNVLRGIRYCHEEKNIVHRDLVSVYS